MRLRHDLLVDGRRWRLRYGTAGDAGDAAKTDFTKAEITISADLLAVQHERDNAFWKEIVHVLDDTREIGLTHRQVHQLGSALHRFCEDNGLQFPRAVKKEVPHG
jgi:hypothetical protein